MGEIEKEYVWGLTHEIAQKLDSGEWARENPADPLHGDDWGESVHQLLIKGEWNRVGESPKLSQHEIEVEEQKRIARAAFLKKRVFEPFFEKGREGFTLQEDGKDLFHFLQEALAKKKEKKDALTPLMQVGREAILATSVFDMHNFARDEFNKYQKEMGKVLIGSDSYLEANAQADFWSKGEQTAFESVEYGYREGLI